MVVQYILHCNLQGFPDFDFSDWWWSGQNAILYLYGFWARKMGHQLVMLLQHHSAKPDFEGQVFF